MNELTLVLPSFNYVNPIAKCSCSKFHQTPETCKTSTSFQLQKRNIFILLEFFFSIPFSKVVHPKEGRGSPVNISLPFNKGWEGRNTVANEVIGLTEDIQVNLSIVRLQTHNLHLHKMCHQLYFLFPKSSTLIGTVQMLMLTLLLKSFWISAVCDSESVAM